MRRMAGNTLFKQRHAEIVNLPNSRLADSAVPSAVNEWQ